MDNDATEVYFELRTSKTSSTLIAYNKRENKITLDRSDSGLLPTNVEGTTRSTILDTPLKQLQIFVDTSSIEIFCNVRGTCFDISNFPDRRRTRY